MVGALSPPLPLPKLLCQPVNITCEFPSRSGGRGKKLLVRTSHLRLPLHPSHCPNLRRRFFSSPRGFLFFLFLLFFFFSFSHPRCLALGKTWFPEWPGGTPVCPSFRVFIIVWRCFLFRFLFCPARGVSPPALPGSAARRMVWKWLGALVVFPLQMIYLVAKAAVGLVLPAKLRDLSRENVLITGGGRGIGRHLAREFAERGARKVRGARRVRRVGAGVAWDRGSGGAGGGVRPPAAAARTHPCPRPGSESPAARLLCATRER